MNRNQIRNQAATSTAVALLILSGCGDHREIKRESVTLLLEHPAKTGLNLTDNQIAPFLYSVRIDGPNGYQLRKQLMPDEIVEVQIPAGPMQIHAAYLAFAIPANATIDSHICESGNDSNKNTTSTDTQTTATTSPISTNLADEDEKKPQVWASEIRQSLSPTEGEVVSLTFPTLADVDMVPFGIQLTGVSETELMGYKFEYIDPVSGEPISPPTDLCPGAEPYSDTIDDSYNLPIISDWPAYVGDGQMSFRVTDPAGRVLGTVSAKLAGSKTLSVDWANNIFNLNVAASPISLVVAGEAEDFDGDGVGNLAELRAGTNPFIKGLDENKLSVHTAYDSNRIPRGWLESTDNWYYREIWCTVDSGPKQSCFNYDTATSGFCIAYDGTSCTAARSGEHTLVVTMVDRTGVSNSITKTFTWTATSANITVTPSINSPTNYTAPTVSGYVDPGASVAIRFGTIAATVTANSTGYFSGNVDLSNLPDGSYAASLTIASSANTDTRTQSLGTYILDTTSPQLISFSPAHQATEVSATPVFSLTFSEPILLSSLYSTETRLNLLVGTHNTNVDYYIIDSATQSGSTVSFTLKYPLPYEGEGTVMLYDYITDLAGNPLISHTGDIGPIGSIIDNCTSDVNNCIPQYDHLVYGWHFSTEYSPDAPYFTFNSCNKTPQSYSQWTCDLGVSDIGSSIADLTWEVQSSCYWFSEQSTNDYPDFDRAKGIIRVSSVGHDSCAIWLRTTDSDGNQRTAFAHFYPDGILRNTTVWPYSGMDLRSPDAVVTLNFPNELDESTITATNITLRNKTENVIITTKLTHKGSYLVVQPETTLLAFKQYELIIKGAVALRDGTTVGTDASFDFNTASTFAPLDFIAAIEKSPYSGTPDAQPNIRLLYPRPIDLSQATIAITALSTGGTSTLVNGDIMILPNGFVFKPATELPTDADVSVQVTNIKFQGSSGTLIKTESWNFHIYY